MMPQGRRSEGWMCALYICSYTHTYIRDSSYLLWTSILGSRFALEREEERKVFPYSSHSQIIQNNKLRTFNPYTHTTTNSIHIAEVDWWTWQKGEKEKKRKVPPKGGGNIIASIIQIHTKPHSIPRHSIELHTYMCPVFLRNYAVVFSRSFLNGISPNILPDDVHGVREIPQLIVHSLLLCQPSLSRTE